MKRSSISRRMSYDMAPVVRSYMSSLDSPRALTCWLLFKYGEFDQLINLEVKPNDYKDRVTFARDYFATKFLSKFDGFNKTGTLRAAAVSAFVDAEQVCKATNERLNRFSYPSMGVERVISRARRKIEKLLGSDLGSSLDSIIEMARFGPGVTTTHKGEWLSPYEKLDHKGQVTTNLGAVLRGSLTPTDYPNWSGIHNPTFVHGNTVTTVPKNSKTDRTIAIEPQINAYFQRGVGRFLASRLRRWNIDLTDQSRNQSLAGEGSITGALATIDLKAASDTVSIECVHLLLPHKWSHLLDVLRSPCYSLDGEWHRYHKHSSMGNGYTFELESLLFSSIVASALKEVGSTSEWSVYGDDIICPVEAYSLVVETLSYLGFSLNPSKSFSTTPFRESCGADWWDGVQVTPFYFKKGSDIVQLITFANWLRSGSPEWLPIAETWKILYFLVPKSWANRGPADSPGILFHVNELEFDPYSVLLKRRPYGPILGYKLKTVNFRSSTRAVVDMPRAVAGSLYQLELQYPAGYRNSWDSLSLYDRVSIARGKGVWNVKAFIYPKNKWPKIRYLSYVP